MMDADAACDVIVAGAGTAATYAAPSAREAGARVLMLDTVRAFNAAPRTDLPFNPNIRDGLSTSGLAIDKTNWAQRLDTRVYEAYAVTTGVTFTCGGRKITNEAEVEDRAGRSAASARSAMSPGS